MKTCFKCRRVLPRTEFYAHPRMADGLLGKCKDCAKSDAKTFRQEHLDEVRASDLQRARRRNPEQLTRQRNRYRRNHPEKVRAHRMVARAVKSGLLVRQPCEACGAEKAEAHHHDYAQPLSVRWLCHRCHHKEHGTLIEVSR